jgi:hypothetical protein
MSKTLKNNIIKPTKIVKYSKTLKNKVFNKNDYNAGDGFLTQVWGPMLWNAMHIISFNYPINPTHNDKIHYKNFILNLKYVLPCKYCRINLIKNFKMLPLTLEQMKNRETFSRYIYSLHELVNKMLNKKSGLSYNDVRERYEHFRARCNTQEKTNIKKEKGCTESLYGEKSKCIIKIVPQDDKTSSFQIDTKCLKKRK